MHLLGLHNGSHTCTCPVVTQPPLHIALHSCSLACPSSPPSHPPAVRRRINYFDYYSRWTAEEQALYSFGCVAGCLAWSAALLATACDLWPSWRQAEQQGDIPLTAALLSGDHLLPVTCAPNCGSSSSVGLSALLAWPQEEVSPRSRRKAGDSTDSLGALLLPALLRMRPT